MRPLKNLLALFPFTVNFLEMETWILLFCRPRRPFFELSTFAGIFAVLLLSGCNHRLPTYPVAGQFKFEDGSVPKFGEIEFFNAEHRLNARGKIERDGSFTVGTFTEGDGAVAGKHRIVVMQAVTTPLVARSVAEAQVKHDHGKLIHQQYIDYRTSGLECEIVPGENRIELVLKPNPKQTDEGLPAH
jgi:hypothetical protein